MIDRVLTVQKSRLGALVGKLDGEEMAHLSRAIIQFLDLAALESE